MIRLAIPNKGRLAGEARTVLELAGLEFDARADRALRAFLGDDFLALFARAADIPEFVADGAADVGITGLDRVHETGRHLENLLDLGFGRCRLVLASREDGDVRRLADVAPATRVATSFPRLVRRFFEERGLEVEIVPVTGAAEIAPHLGVAEIVADLTSTGSTLEVNGLAEFETILESSAVLVARRESMRDTETGPRVNELVAALESVIRARGKRYLMANVPRASLEAVKRILPGISGPTIVDVLNSGDHVAAHAVVDHANVYRTISELKRVGAQGILVSRIERLMP